MRKATLFTISKRSLPRLMYIALMTGFLYTLSAQDCATPTVFCQDIHTSFMQEACMVEVWAKDFISKINDGSDMDDFIVSFDEEGNEMNRIFESVDGNSFEEVTIWIIPRCDSSLRTRCVVALDINDNTGDCPTGPCPVDPNPWCGWAVITCSTIQDSPTEFTGHVAALIDTRKNSQAPRGDDWTNPITPNEDTVDVIRPEAWRINNLGNIFGIAVNPANGKIFFGASDIYDYDFRNYIQIGPPPPAVEGPAGAAGIYRTCFDDPETVTVLTSTLNSYPSDAQFNATIIGSNRIPNTGNDPNDLDESGNGIGNLDHDNRSNHLVVSNLEDGKLYSINAETGIVTDVYDPFMNYVHSPGIVTPSEQVWGVAIRDCGLNSRVFFTRSAINPTFEVDVIQRKDVYSIALNPDGTFAGVERIEFIVEKGDMEKLTDIAFNSACDQILVSERGNPHSSEVHRYIELNDGTWVDDRQFFVGTFDSTNVFEFYPNGIFGNSSSGGVTFGSSEEGCTIDNTCNGLVWATINCGDIAADDSGPPNPSDCAIYGAQGINATGNELATLDMTDIYVHLDDRDVNNPIILKSNIGDIEIFNCCCPIEPGRNTPNMAVSAIVAGEIYTEDLSRIQNSEVQISSSKMSDITTTNQNGEFYFENLSMHDNYKIVPQKTDNISDGLSTFDLILIQKHILGLQRFKSPYKIVAADINRDYNVSALDMVMIRQLILGTISGEDIPPWAFIPRSFEFDNPQDPFPYENHIAIKDLESNMMHEDFIGIKKGDVNGDNSVNSLVKPRSAQQRKLNVAKDGKIYNVSLNQDMNMSGIQFELLTDDFSSFKNVIPGLLKIQETNYHIFQNSIKFSWDHLHGIDAKKGTTLFQFELLEESSSISLGQVELKAELYNTNNEVFDLTLNESIQDQNSFSLRNFPNPFKEQTTISFELPTSQIITLEFYSTSGHVLYSHTKFYNQGINSFVIDGEEFNNLSDNIIIYKLINEESSAVGKMIYIR